MQSSDIVFCNLAPNPGLRVGPEIAFTHEAMREALDFLLARPAEQGGLLFGPFNKAGVDHFEADPVGSGKASRTRYSPDNDSLESAGQKQLDEGREIKGIIHTHPGEGATYASSEAGYGRGDLGYARKFFDLNESAFFCLFPIITLSRGAFTVSPFVFMRGHENGSPELLWSPLRVTDPGGFGLWDYNPEWLRNIQPDQ